MLRPWPLLAVALCLLALHQPRAQDAADAVPAEEAPPPAFIKPPEATGSPDPILSTKPSAALPWKKSPPASPTNPPATPSAPSPTAPAAVGAQAVGGLKPAMPFGKATPRGTPIPEAPHGAVASPVEDVERVEVSEPAAPPAPPPPEADPVNEDASIPTPLTAPIFTGAEDVGGPRTVVVRALNKVSAQAQEFGLSPGETARFGQLILTAEMCRVSDSASPRDDAGLLTIAEEQPVRGTPPKLLFHGWMYASSPSLRALEHPIYDVTMVRCAIADSKSADTAKKPAKKPAAGAH